MHLRFDGDINVIIIVTRIVRDKIMETFIDLTSLVVALTRVMMRLLVSASFTNNAPQSKSSLGKNNLLDCRSNKETISRVEIHCQGNMKPAN